MRKLMVTTVVAVGVLAGLMAAWAVIAVLVSMERASAEETAPSTLQREVEAEVETVMTDLRERLEADRRRPQ